MIKDFLYRLVHPARGLKRAIRDDFSVRTQVWLGAVIVGATWYFNAPLSDLEILLLLLAWLLVLSAEVQNSPLETALNELHPERANAIGHSKDLAAGAVMVVSLFAFIIIGYITYTHQFAGV